MQNQLLVLSVRMLGLVAFIFQFSVATALAEKCLPRTADEIIQPVMTIETNAYDTHLYGREIDSLGIITNSKNEFKGIFYQYLKANKDQWGNIPVDGNGLAIQKDTCDYFAAAELAKPEGATIDSVDGKKVVSVEIHYDPGKGVGPLSFSYLYNGIFGTMAKKDALLKFNTHTQTFELFDEDDQRITSAYIFANRLFGKKVIGVKDIELYP